MASYELALLLVGLAVLGAVALPRVLADKPMSFPMVYVVAGMVLFSLPFGMEFPDPLEYAKLTERLTELVVIIALMGAGLKIDRPFALGSWRSTWRLLLITMPITIALTALLGWGMLGTVGATAVLLGAVVAPTDPVLASDVQATPPTENVDEEVAPEDQEGDIRFTLTSEAGLNDGLAFPFTNLAIAMAASGAGSYLWLAEWALVDVVYKIAVGTVMGYVTGWVLAWFIFGAPATTNLAKVMAGAEALAATLLSYGVTELLHGYGFIAVFVSALVMRHYEWEHDYYLDLHDFAVLIERLLMAAILVLFGGAIAAGLLAPLGWTHVVVGVVVVFVVRPVAGLAGLLGSSLTWAERFAVSSFGIRGIGSFYYLSHALNEATLREFELLVAGEELWALVGFIVLLSIVAHGTTANYIMSALDRQRTGGGVSDSPVGAQQD